MISFHIIGWQNSCPEHNGERQRSAKSFDTAHWSTKQKNIQNKEITWTRWSDIALLMCLYWRMICGSIMMTRGIRLVICVTSKTYWFVLVILCFQVQVTLHVSQFRSTFPFYLLLFIFPVCVMLRMYKTLTIVKSVLISHYSQYCMNYW